MKAREHAAFRQHVDVPPYRLQRHTDSRERVDGCEALAADFFEKGGLAGIQGHARPSCMTTRSSTRRPTLGASASKSLMVSTRTFGVLYHW